MFVLVTIASGATLPAEPPVLTHMLSIEMSAPVLASKWLDVSNTLVIRYGHGAVAVVLLKLAPPTHCVGI